MQGLVAFFVGFGVWNWFILAVLLFVLEFALPGVHFLWFGMAAVVVGLLALATGLTWPYQVIAFGIIAVLTVFAVRRYVRPDVSKSDLPDLNERALQYVGRSLVVAEAIANGRGKVRVGDSVWQAEGPDVPAGGRVKVTGARGTVLVVEAERATA
ncbi:MAG: NfeD family protein [Hyphomicrobiaceae bacterium]|nr:NfeD family protein [Hyphomicrobiaceae bacterium]